MAKYTLPDLPYDYGALEPHISGKIMQLHHDKHHKAYVDGANKAMDELAEARSKEELMGKIPWLEMQLAFHVSGHALHSLFWQNMAPKGGGQPTGDLKNAIDHDFGGFENFRRNMTQAAATIMGSGWAALMYEPMQKKLVVTQIHDHQSHVTQGSVPLMVIDAWEHAFYLQYGPAKADYFKAIWNLWNWQDVGQRFAHAKNSDLKLMGIVG